MLLLLMMITVQICSNGINQNTVMSPLTMVHYHKAEL